MLCHGIGPNSAKSWGLRRRGSEGSAADATATPDLRIHRRPDCGDGTFKALSTSQSWP